MTHIEARDIDKHWDKVRSGLERILAKYQQSWRPEHVYVALSNGDAVLSLIGDDAWLVWSRYPGDDRRGMLFVWACEGKGLGEHQVPVEQELEQMARGMKCRTVRIIGRRGWGRSPFWTECGTVFEHTVGD